MIAACSGSTGGRPRQDGSGRHQPLPDKPSSGDFLEVLNGRTLTLFGAGWATPSRALLCCEYGSSLRWATSTAASTCRSPPSGARRERDLRRVPHKAASCLSAPLLAQAPLRAPSGTWSHCSRASIHRIGMRNLLPGAPITRNATAESPWIRGQLLDSGSIRGQLLRKPGEIGVVVARRSNRSVIV